MELKLFGYVDEAIENLEAMQADLEVASEELENYIEELLTTSEGGYININSRVKSASSLKEKILRNSYYKKYDTPELLLSNLSDLIGVRVECNFIDDEARIYKILQNHFCTIDKNGYYYNRENRKIRLDLSGEQPQEQKNGFVIYRIDGNYAHNGQIFNFEMQIKSLINVFWGEIEHKLIYKNSNYLVYDSFVKDILGSIKNNLAMIDRQLQIMNKEFSKSYKVDNSNAKSQMELILSKMIYNTFSSKMEESIGFVVDFRESCDAIMKYLMRKKKYNDVEAYYDIMMDMFSRINEIRDNEVQFDTEIVFEREIEFDDEFSIIVGKTILNAINDDFRWNTFFKIFFELERGNNAEDFEAYIRYVRNSFYLNKSVDSMYLIFDKEESDEMVNSLMIKTAQIFMGMGNIEMVYNGNARKINEILDQTVNRICNNVESYEEWLESRDIYLELYALKLLAMFKQKLKVEDVKSFLEEVRQSNSKVMISPGFLNYIGTLESKDEIDARKVIKFFKALDW